MIDLHNYLENKFNENNFIGFSCAVSYNNEIFQYNFGKSNLEHGLGLSDSSIFNIASVGKLFTAVSVFKLIEQGKLDLRIEIGNILQDIPDTWKHIRIEHLLSHSSGIKNYTDVPEYWSESRLDVSRQRIIEYVSDSDLHFEAGTHWRYSNTGFYLLGLIIEKVSNLDYFQFVLNLIADYKSDLKIFPIDYHEIIPDRVQGYQQTGAEIRNAPYYSKSGSYAAGGFLAALKDFLEFEKALFNGKILKADSVGQLSSPFIKPDGKILKSPDPVHDFEMAHGLFRLNKGGKLCLAHRGEIFGFSTAYMRIPEDNFSVIISTNLDDRNESSDLTYEVYNLIVS